HAQGAAKGLEYGFTLVVSVLALEIVDVQSGQGMIREALKELARQVHIEASDMRARERDVVEQARPARKVDHHARQRFVQRYIRMAVAAHAGLVADSGGEGLPQGDANVLHGVVVV